MADNLPLLPDKGVAVCADVRQVLREVFRELEHAAPAGDAALPLQGDCRIKDSSADHNKLIQQERELQKEYARRLSREPLPNIHQLCSPAASVKVEQRKSEPLILRRKDLKPSVDQNASGDRSLWLQNILNRSSGDLGALRVAGSSSRVNRPMTLEAAEVNTVQSVSIGELLPRASLPPTAPAAPAPEPAHVACVPPSLEFVNFTVGQLHTRCIRLVNVSKWELRLSVRPPARRELHVQLCSRLALTAGAAAELRVHFRASDVRALADELLVRVSAGRALRVPIACYVEPPQLHIRIPGAATPCLSAASSSTAQSDTLELGARLLGDVHRVPLLLRCDSTHACFFLVSEDSWTHWDVQVTASSSRNLGIRTDCFHFRPARWAGRTARGLAVCRAPAAGLHAAALRVVASTAIVRPLSFVADSMLFSPGHVTLEAHDKDYDICSEDDPACEYYVNLGVAFPRRSLASTVKLVNNSPLTYDYYWSVRPWGACSCWRHSQLLPASECADETLCPGAPGAKHVIQQGGEPLSDETEEARRAVRVSAASGCLRARADTAVRVHVPDAGAVLRTRRAVLMLILSNVPEESLPSNYDPMIVKTSEVEEKCIPGVSPQWSRRVCDVVCAQLEVRWQVAPVRFLLHPPLILLPCSRRVKSVVVPLRCTQLCGTARVRATWRQLPAAPPPPALAPLQAALTTVTLPLRGLPDQFPHSQLIQLVAESDEWSSSCRVERWCGARHPALRPAVAWLGVRPPRALAAARLAVLNDTHQHICWWASVHRWCHERGPAAPCEERAPCAACYSRACACAALSPTRGALAHEQSVKLRYCVSAPDADGCVATLVQVKRAAADCARVLGARGTEARAALLAYRVLAPRLVLRVQPCLGDEARECEGCALDPGCSVLGGSPVLRPSAALSLGGRCCCRLQLSNVTPLPTSVNWMPAVEGEDTLAVTFVPNEFHIGGHSTVHTLVVLEARAACTRRAWLREARVAHAHAPLYLLIDAAISGVEVTVEFPIGAEENTDCLVKIPMAQPERPCSTTLTRLLTPEQMFAQDDCKRALQRERICHCRGEMLRTPPPPGRPGGERGDHSPVSISEQLPPPPRAGPCAGLTPPGLPEDTEPYCLQFRDLPIRTVRSRTLVLHNVSRLDARWIAAVRRWPRKHARTIGREQWAGDVHEAGVVLECAPRGGLLAARGRAALAVSAYADCWGLYRDQLLIQPVAHVQVEGLSPLVLDVWLQAVGAPLQLALCPAPRAAHPPALWMSYSDPDRVARVTNTSRADLTSDVYLLREHEHVRDELPFRLYLRLCDVAPRACPCAAACESHTQLKEDAAPSNSSCCGDMDTDVELFLAPDLGVQSTDGFYQVEPQQLRVRAGDSAALSVRLQHRQQLAPPHAVLLRSAPRPRAGRGWCRPPPPPQLLQLRQAPRASQLQVLSCELRVALCALDLPDHDILRVRKKFRIQNIGEGPLETVAATEAPWRVEVSRDVCDARCVRLDRSRRSGDLELTLAPRSSLELFAEVSARTADVWPPPGAAYPPGRVTRSALHFYDHGVLLLSLPLILELEQPVLCAEPAALDFGFVSDGSSRKAYFTVSHSSLSTLELVTQWSGDQQFHLHPSALSLRGGARGRIYVQYTARWVSDSFSEGVACVCASGAAGAWCRVTLSVRARPARPRALHAARHVDHTDDAHLLPQSSC